MTKLWDLLLDLYAAAFIAAAVFIAFLALSSNLIGTPPRAPRMIAIEIELIDDVTGALAGVGYARDLDGAKAWRARRVHYGPTIYRPLMEQPQQ